MEVEEIQTQARPSKFPRIDFDSLKVGQHNPLEEEDDLKLPRMAGDGTAADNSTNRLRGWHHSRIIRVSRASGGKDRHSKVLTSKGLRDRRVRLSVSTAIQFYDIQDRLGYDQPSKAVEWLIKAASEAIAELPSLNTFPDTSKQLSNEKRVSEGDEQGFDSADVEIEDDLNYQSQNNQQQQQHVSLSKSACSSTSETSKGSSLSLSRSEIRVNRVKKSRERARERTAKEKKDPPQLQASQGGLGSSASLAPPISQNSSFTELLTAGITSNSSSSPSGPVHQPNTASRQWPLSSPMDYFSTGQLLSRAQNLPGFLGQIQLPQTMPIQVPPFSVSGEGNNGNNNSNNHHQELQHISFVNAEHLNLIPLTSSSGGEYNLNFTISPSSVSSSSSSPGLITGFNRGTLQSNLPHLQRFTSAHHHVDGSTNLPFFIGAAAVSSPVDTGHHNHHQLQQLHIGQFSSGIDGRLQLCYGDGSHHGTDHKGKTAKS